MSRYTYQQIVMCTLLFIVVGLAVAGCKKSIETLVLNTYASPRQHMPLALPIADQYQALNYQATAQRDPFAPLYPQNIEEPHLLIGQVVEPECVLKNSQPTVDIAQNWALRATFNGGQHPTAIIDIPNVGATMATIGQQLIAQEHNLKFERVEVMAISGQQVTLKHHQGEGVDCLHAQIITLNLYD